MAVTQQTCSRHFAVLGIHGKAYRLLMILALPTMIWDVPRPLVLEKVICGKVKL